MVLSCLADVDMVSVTSAVCATNCFTGFLSASVVRFLCDQAHFIHAASEEMISKQDNKDDQTWDNKMEEVSVIKTHLNLGKSICV